MIARITRQVSILLYDAYVDPGRQVAIEIENMRRELPTATIISITLIDPDADAEGEI